VVIGAEAMSRRRFLRHSAVLAMLTAAPASLLRSLRLSTPPSLARSRFAPALGTMFTMTGGAGAVEVMLAEINDLSPLRRAEDEDRFALLFEAPDGQPCPDGIRTFHHRSVGDVTLFVSPVDRGQALRLQAVIDRSRST
jgi:hypothetical protein